MQGITQSPAARTEFARHVARAFTVYAGAAPLAVVCYAFLVYETPMDQALAIVLGLERIVFSFAAMIGARLIFALGVWAGRHTLSLEEGQSEANRDGVMN